MRSVIISFVYYGEDDPKKSTMKKLQRLGLAAQIPENRIGCSVVLNPFAELYSVNKADSHVTGIHVLPFEEFPFSLLPKRIRQAVLPIFMQYTSGVYALDNGSWKKTQKYDSIMA